MRRCAEFVEPHFCFEEIEFEAATMGAGVAEFGNGLHESEIESGIAVQFGGEFAGIEVEQYPGQQRGGGVGEIGTPLPGRRPAGRGEGSDSGRSGGFEARLLPAGLLFEPFLVGAETPAGYVVDGDARAADSGKAGGDFSVGEAVVEEAVDEVAEFRGETGDFAVGTAGEARRRWTLLRQAFHLRRAYGGQDGGQGMENRGWRWSGFRIGVHIFIIMVHLDADTKSH